MSRPANREEAKRWLAQGSYDLKAADWNLKGGFFNTACFLAQQGAEKAVKSLLYYNRISRKKMLSHSVVELLSLIQDTLPGAAELLDEARELDLHYIPSRYPNGLPGGLPHTFYSEKTASRALEAGKAIIALIEDYYRQQGFEWSRMAAAQSPEK
jgi:HEPN domain-containing protein